MHRSHPQACAAETTENWIVTRVRQDSDQCALVAEGGRWTYAELARDARRYAAILANLLEMQHTGHKATRVAVLAGNCAEYVLLIAASLQLGLQLVPLNIRLSAPELITQLQDCKPDLLLHDEARRTDVARVLEAWDAVPSASSNSKPKPRVLSFQDALALPGLQDNLLDTLVLPSFDLGCIATVMYTSGSTGTPKGVLQTYGNHWHSAHMCQANLEFSPSSSWGCPTPLFHTSGLSIIMRSLAVGTGVRLYDRFDATAINDDILSGRITCLSAVTYQIERMLEDFGRHPNPTYPPTLDFVLQGGGPMPISALEEADRLRLPVVQSFGMTETSSQVVALCPKTALEKIGSSGRPLQGVEVRIDPLGPNTMPSGMLPVGTEGRILLKSPSLCIGYLGQQGRFAESFTPDGWFDTGDCGHLDADGYLYVACRMSDLIVSGGENVYPAEVEAALTLHPAVAEAAVVGAPDPRWGSVPVAICVAPPQWSAPLPSAKLLNDFCRTKLASYKCPRRFIWVEELPRTASSKLKRAALLPLAQGAQAFPPAARQS